MHFLRSRAVILFTVLLVLQGVGSYYLNARQEYVPHIPPLATLPTEFGGWRMAAEFPIEPEVQEVLKATDTLSRIYVSPGSPMPVSLFLAYFQSQRSGVAPHSPRNCLPGNGWVPERSQIIHLPVPGRAEPIEVNEYVVQKGDVKNVVVYWYQSHNRVVASEYKAKVFVVADAIRANRTDTALVRVIATVPNGDVDKAVAEAHRFVYDSFPLVTRALPN